MDKQKADPSKVLNYGPHLTKDNAQRFGIDVTQGKHPIEEVTEKERFAVPTSAANLGVEFEKELKPEIYQEFLRWGTNKGLSNEHANSLYDYMKKHRMKISEMFNWNKAYKEVMRIAKLAEIELYAKKQAEAEQEYNSHFDDETKFLNFCNEKQLSSKEIKDLIGYLKINNLNLTDQANWEKAYIGISKVTSNVKIITILENISQELLQVVKLLKG